MYVVSSQVLPGMRLGAAYIKPKRVGEAAAAAAAAWELNT